MTSTLTPQPDVATPSLGERCDRCGAAAKVRAVLPGGGDLVFCQHHANQYQRELEKIATTITMPEPEPETA